LRKAEKPEDSVDDAEPVPCQVLYEDLARLDSRLPLSRE
jgi:hypothetical protein